jgi:hypothetical protein
MTNAARRLIDSFEALPEQEKHEVLAQLLRSLISSPDSSPSDDELTHVADLVFQDYDRAEAQGEACRSKKDQSIPGAGLGGCNAVQQFRFAVLHVLRKMINPG